MENSGRLRKLLFGVLEEKIYDTEIRDYATIALDHAPEEFWTSPSSGTGKYHPPEDQGYGGLVRHSIKCAYISDELAQFFGISETDRNVVIAASALHDIQKNGIPWKEVTDFRHGKIAYDWLGQFPLREPEKEIIRKCVRHHMYRWCEPKEESIAAINAGINEKIVQLSDFFSSRKCASFLPGVDVPEHLISNYF